MKYKIEQISDTLLVIRPKHWWSDPLPIKDVLAALVEVSRDRRVVSVCKIGTWSSAHLVVVERTK